MNSYLVCCQGVARIDEGNGVQGEKEEEEEVERRSISFSYYFSITFLPNRISRRAGVSVHNQGRDREWASMVVEGRREG